MSFKLKEIVKELRDVQNKQQSKPMKYNLLSDANFDTDTESTDKAVVGGGRDKNINYNLRRLEKITSKLKLIFENIIQNGGYTEETEKGIRKFVHESIQAFGSNYETYQYGGMPILFGKKKTVGDSVIGAAAAVTGKVTGIKEVSELVKTVGNTGSKTAKSALKSGTDLAGKVGTIGMSGAKKAFEKSKAIAGDMEKDLKGLRETSDNLLKI